MKILHLICYFNDKLDYQENRLIKLQKKNGHDVCLITSDRFYPFKNYENTYYTTLGKRKIGIKKYNYFGAKIIRKKTFFEFAGHSQCFFFNFFEIIRFSPDVIHIHNCGIYNFLSSFIYALIFKKKIFIDCHQDKHNTNINFFNKFHYFFWKNIYNIFKKKISLFLPINELSKKYLVDFYKININKIKISPLGFEKYNRNSHKFKNNISEKLLIKKNLNEKLIVNSGKQNEEKKIEALIELTKILNKKNFLCKLLLIGNTSLEYNKTLDYKIRSTNLILGQNKIIKISFQKKERLRKFLELADIAVWPGIPSITIQEALYANNIILLPKNSASSNLISSEYLFFSKDLNQVANNIIKIFSNKNLISKIRNKNKKILNDLEWLNINKDLEKYYINY